MIRLHAELVQATLAIYEVGTGKRIVEAPVCRNGQREDVVAFELPASGSYVARLSDVLGQLVTVQFTVLRCCGRVRMHLTCIHAYRNHWQW